MRLKNIKQIVNRKSKLVTWIILGFFVVVGSIAFTLSSMKIQKDTQQQRPLEQEELIKSIKPSIVRIIQHAKGTGKLAAFDIDLKKLTVIPLDESEDVDISIDDYISGSGSIINPDGYIVTNSHVVSEKTIKNSYIENTARERLMDKINSLSAAEQKKYFPTEEASYKLTARVLAYMEEYSTFNIRSEITVLNPSSRKEDIEDLVLGGFPAEVTYVNEHFSEDQRDVAIIKISQNNLPSIRLNQGTPPSVGDKIFVFGFPATADFNSQNPIESTLTQGVVSASKYSDDKNFRVFQTDAKISQGSSGGPMLNAQGEVIGLVTFETGEYLRQAGDNFAFAIPIKLAQEIIEKEHIANVGGGFAEHFKKGLSFYKQDSCQAALEEFSEAKMSNKFFASEQYVKPYIETCKQKMTDGNSIDTKLQLLFSRIGQISPLAWFVLLGRAVLIIIGVWVALALSHRLSKSEEIIEELETEIQELQSSSVSTTELPNNNVPLPLPEEGLYHFSNNGIAVPHPHLVEYIKDARAVGLHDDLTKQDLLGVGWKEEAVDHALRHDHNS